MLNDSALGKKTVYQSSYNPKLLTAVSRDVTRLANNITEPLKFKGTDIWNAWELSWLDMKGKPVVASARIAYSAYSTHLIESKSFKLYLNSFNQTSFDSMDKVVETLIEDLSNIVNSLVEVTLYSVDDNWPRMQTATVECIDHLDINITDYEVTSAYLEAATDRSSDDLINEQLCTHLFKSNCMVTGQPDWASVFINYHGVAIEHSLLLKYLISYRNHQAFHEPCAERIFMDIMEHCQPEFLSVYCRYTRRGGLDINPFRYSLDTSNAIGDINNPSNDRIWRQ